MTRAVRIHRHGGPEVLELETLEIAPPGAGELLMRQTAVGLNYIDTYHRSGLYPIALPSGIGIEAAGVVEQVGPGVTRFKPGDRVGYASGAPGAYAEARVVSAERLIPLPAEISDEVAAATLLKGMTVESLVRRTYPVQAGQSVLLHAAAGGVGLIACQWLKAIGARVIGTVGSDDKARLAREHGCDEVIVYTRENFVERVRALTAGAGVPVVYDSVGKATFEGSLECLSPRGMLVSFGNASGKPPPLELGVLAQKGSLYVTRPTLPAYTARREDLLASASALFDMLHSGAIRVTIAQRFRLEQAREAHLALEGRRTLGSSVFSV